MYSFSSLCEGKSLNLGGLVVVESISPLFAEIFFATIYYTITFLFLRQVVGV